MNGRRTLEQIGILKTQIKQRQEQLRELRSSAMSLPGIRYDTIRVTTSASGDGLANELIRIEQKEEEIRTLIEQLERTRDRIIGLIHMVEDRRYEEILFAYYVQGVTLVDIAGRMFYNYTYCSKLHQQALEAFEDVCNKSQHDM